MITDSMAVALLLGSFAFFIIIRMPIAYGIGLSCIITTFYLGIPLETVAQNLVKGVNLFALLAVPFFILAGELMGAGGIAKRLIKLANALVGWMRGGLAMVNIVASTFFGGISGSSAADTSALGSILIPLMNDEGYDNEFSTAVTMASSVQAILIPPSHNMVIFSLVAGGLSIGRLFMAGFIPGILLGVALMIYSYIVSVRRNYPVGDSFKLGVAVRALIDAFWGLVTVLIVVFGVITGVFTATESAAIACVYAFVITFFVYREIPFSRLPTILLKAGRTLAIVMIVIAASAAFGWLLAYLQVPKMISDAILGFTRNKIIVLVLLNLLLLFFGMIMDMGGIILIVTPILLPVATAVGVDPIHFGIIMMMNLGIGLITPPVGPTLFLGSAISGLGIERLTKAMMPFFGVMLITLLIITYVPSIVMFLPNLVMP